MHNRSSVVLAGLESSGKSALFRGLTGSMTGDESNFRGSTVMCRSCYSAECDCEIIDTPGIRVKSDSETTRMAFDRIDSADTVLLVVRGTHIQSELANILNELRSSLNGKRAAIAVTFEDRASLQVYQAADYYKKNLGVPVSVLNARNLTLNRRNELIENIRNANVISDFRNLSAAPAVPLVHPQKTWFERATLGPILAILNLILFFAVPVVLAYQFAAWLQPLIDQAWIMPFKDSLKDMPSWFRILFIGDYGLLTLGWYSFLWAFPVVALIGLSVALLDETGLKDRITTALDPWLRKIGLSGRDLVPVLTGFGCNVVAVFQTRSCSACTRKSCISMISFGSACSYQIGAALSIFAASGHPGLFAPYLFTLFVMAAIHTRIWYGSLSSKESLPLSERALLQKPSWRAIGWKVRAVIKQFLYQAMPIFLIICAAAALLQMWGILDKISDFISPAVTLFSLPASVAPAILFSILRKDGLLILNQGEGQLLHTLSAGQIFVLVYLASTLTACLVTLGTVVKETGWKNASRLAFQQAVTSILSTFLIASTLRSF